MAVLLLRLNLPPSLIWIAYSSLGFDIRANHLFWNVMDLTQIFFSRKDKLENFEVFISESVCSKANTETLKSGGWQDYKLLGLKFYYGKHIFLTNSFFWSSAAPLASSCTSKSSRVFLNWIISQTGRNRQDKIFFWVASRYIFYKNIWFGHLVSC